MFREKMQLWVREAIAAEGGEASIVNVAKHIWHHHENDLRQAGDRFYLWQYDMRWAAQDLRNKGRLKLKKVGSRSIWGIS